MTAPAVLAAFGWRWRFDDVLNDPMAGFQRRESHCQPGVPETSQPISPSPRKENRDRPRNGPKISLTNTARARLNAGD